MRRIGLLGYNAPTGLGELNRQIDKYIPIEKWLVVPHRGYGCQITSKRMTDDVDEFLSTVDTILFCETPFSLDGTLKRMVCVPMLEWLPRGAWTDDVDLFLCPTHQCYREIGEYASSFCPWPIDVSRFPFRHRKTCQQFLFLNGHGGYRGRKGAAVVKAAKELWPEMPLLVRSQKKESWPKNTVVLPTVECNSDLYREGDVLIAPHRVDGLGLELQEAMASGMPVISTEGDPWNEYPAIERIASTKFKMRFPRREVTWCEPDPVSLVDKCRSLLGRSIGQESTQAREWAESRDWSDASEWMTELIRGASS